MRKKIVLLLVMMFMVISSIQLVMAQNDVPDQFSEFIDASWKVILQAVLTGVCTSILGYLKHTKPENFSLLKLTVAIALGFCIGMLMVQFGWDYSTSEQWLASTGLSIWLYWVIKILLIRAGVIEKELATK